MFGIERHATQSPDTSREAEEVLFALYRAAGPLRLLRKAGALGASARRLALQRLRARHPSASDRELRLRLAASYIPQKLMGELWGWAPPPDEAWGP